MPTTHPTILSTYRVTRATVRQIALNAHVAHLEGKSDHSAIADAVDTQWQGGFGCHGLRFWVPTPDRKAVLDALSAAVTESYIANYKG